MNAGKIFNLTEGKFVDHLFCDVCGWGDTCLPGVVIEGHGTFDLCHRHNTVSKFLKGVKLFSRYKLIQADSSFKKKFELLKTM